MGLNMVHLCMEISIMTSDKWRGGPRTSSVTGEILTSGVLHKWDKSSVMSIALLAISNTNSCKTFELCVVVQGPDFV